MPIFSLPFLMGPATLLLFPLLVVFSPLALVGLFLNAVGMTEAARSISEWLLGVMERFMVM